MLSSEDSSVLSSPSALPSDSSDVVDVSVPLVEVLDSSVSDVLVSGASAADELVEVPSVSDSSVVPARVLLP